MVSKPEKMYQISTKCTKWSKNITNVLEMFKMARKYINILQPKLLQDLPKLGFLV
jgi:hypothetical protein